MYNGGLLLQRQVRRILTLAGYQIRLGRPGEGDLIGVWGKSPTAYRGEAAAEKHKVPLVRIEDAWLRSLFPGRAGKAGPIGLLIDHSGVHFDPSVPSDLENILAEAPLDDTALLDRARGAIARMREAGLTKYTACEPDIPAPRAGYVLVIDQTHGDASVRAGGADSNRFREMLYWAQEENPGARILIKTHPENAQGFREGYFKENDASDRIEFFAKPISPWQLFEGAVAVYTVSSQMGFEAIFAGHKPRVFGQPFYSGWGLTADEFPPPRRRRNLTRAQLFAASMILYPTWYDPNADRLCSYEDAAEALAAQTRAWVEDKAGYVASGIRLWKRTRFNQTLGRLKPLVFENDLPKAQKRATTKSARHLIWASLAGAENMTEVVRIEDGFLRSRGLGAELVPALSLTLDDLGIYYDPSRPSRLEEWIVQRANLRPDQDARARALISALVRQKVTKYNVGAAPPDMPKGHRILVVGQVEDDASIRLGASGIRSNTDLLALTREKNPDAVILYKPHPDVEAGLRDGKVDATPSADIILTSVNPALLLPHVNEVWSITSLLGFEALLHGVSVTTCGAPFYAGWGLTTDLGEVPARRRGPVSLAGLVHATLIDYPRYFDPKTGAPCPVEHAVRCIVQSDGASLGPLLRALSKLQGAVASYKHLWR